MQYFRQKRKIINLTRVISLTVILRSFIAPGYMLSASIDDGLELIFCDGPVSLTSTDDDHSSHHRHHNIDDGIEQEIHISPVCSHWSTSSVLVLNTLFEPTFVFIIRHDEQTRYQSNLVTQTSDNTNDIRGPPLFS